MGQSGLASRATAALASTVLVLPRADLCGVPIFLAAILLISVTALLLSVAVVRLRRFGVMRIRVGLVHASLLKVKCGTGVQQAGSPPGGGRAGVRYWGKGGKQASCAQKKCLL